jgi:cobalt-zinc-cadmium efflux system protein
MQQHWQLHWIAIKIGKLPADDKRTFGYQRFEILAALFNALMLFVVAFIFYMKLISVLAIRLKFRVGMMVVAIGLVINLISMKILFSSSR